MRAVASTGLLFFVLQVVSAVSYSSNAIIIAQTLGASVVAEYAVPEKLFALIGTVLAMMIAPLWPAYSEAIARGDHAWAKTMLRRSMAVSVGVAAACSAPLVAFGPWIIGAWIGHAVAPSGLLLLSFGVWKVIEAGGNALAMFLNGAKFVKIQVFIAIITGLAALALKIYLVKKIGVSGVNWATIVSFLLLALVPYSFVLRKYFRSETSPCA
jgi:O-antigen/teichoic acid export membrane protein